MPETKQFDALEKAGLVGC